MKIERNPYFKPEEAVLYCGDAYYSRLQSRGEPEIPKGYMRTWKIQIQRRGVQHMKYVHIKKGRATLKQRYADATIFHSYKEAEEIARQILERGNAVFVNIVEVLSYDYVEEDYAP